MQIVLRGQIKSMRVVMKCEGRKIKDYGGKLQGKRLRRKIKG